MSSLSQVIDPKSADRLRLETRLHGISNESEIQLRAVAELIAKINGIFDDPKLFDELKQDEDLLIDLGLMKSSFQKMATQLREINKRI